KRHTKEDFVQVVKLFDGLGLVLNPTFVPFTPWTSLDGYRELLESLIKLDLVENVSPVQLAIRLLIPAGSKLLELPETSAVMGPFNEELLSYEWQNPDPLVDELQQRVMKIVSAGNSHKATRQEIFRNVWDSIDAILDKPHPLPEPQNHRSRAAIPYLNEPWYC
ncbi:radical SAM protein, partial [candidate division KSB1 bacterium]|nr:radical SAM protein [candidate division KSB1 bacterium]